MDALWKRNHLCFASTVFMRERKFMLFFIKLGNLLELKLSNKNCNGYKIPFMETRRPIKCIFVCFNIYFRIKSLNFNYFYCTSYARKFPIKSRVLRSHNWVVKRNLCYIILQNIPTILWIIDEKWNFNSYTITTYELLTSI